MKFLFSEQNIEDIEKSTMLDKGVGRFGAGKSEFDELCELSELFERGEGDLG